MGTGLLEKIWWQITNYKGILGINFLDIKSRLRKMIVQCLWNVLSTPASVPFARHNRDRRPLTARFQQFPLYFGHLSGAEVDAWQTCSHAISRCHTKKHVANANSCALFLVSIRYQVFIWPNWRLMIQTELMPVPWIRG